MGTQERAGRVPGLGFGARPTQLFSPSGSRGYQASSSRASQSYEARQLDERLREREQEIADREARLNNLLLFSFIVQFVYVLIKL